jgi:hypothetical protein
MRTRQAPLLPDCWSSFFLLLPKKIRIANSFGKLLELLNERCYSNFSLTFHQLNRPKIGWTCVRRRCILQQTASVGSYRFFTFQTNGRGHTFAWCASRRLYAVSCKQLCMNRAVHVPPPEMSKSCCSLVEQMHHLVLHNI